MNSIFEKDKKFHEGSMGAAQEKTKKVFRIVGAVVYLAILYALFLGDTYLNDIQARAGVFVGIIGFLFIVASYVLLWFADNVILPIKSEWFLGFSIIALLALGICIACGFNFDLAGIRQR